MSSGVILVCSVCMFLSAPFLISVFTKDADVIAIGSDMVRIFASLYIALPVVQILNGALRGGRPLQNPHVLHAGELCGAAPDLPDDRGSSDGQRERGDGGLAPHVGDLCGRHGLVLL